MKFRKHEHLPEEFPEEHFTMPADNVDPHPASRQTVAFFILFNSIIVIAAVIAVIIIANTTTSTSNGLKRLVNQQEDRGQLRDTQHTQNEEQFRKQQQQITKLTNDLRNTQIRDNQAVCTLIIGLLQENKLQNPNRPVDTKIVGPFLNEYGCKVPAGLLS